MENSGGILKIAVLVLASGIFFVGCAKNDKNTEDNQKRGKQMESSLKSSGFENNGFIPVKYTGLGEDISPGLSWSGIPSGVESFALICDDPDAPGKTWVHWVIYNIPSSRESLLEGFHTAKEFPDGVRQGVNDFGKTGYGGPNPPAGKAHRYFFKLYALDIVLDLEAGTTKPELETAMAGHILGKAEIVGLFKRP